VRNTVDTTVVLWMPGITELRSTTTGEDGSFTFHGLRPGDYRIVALKDAGLIPADDRETWRELETQAVAVALREGARVRIALSPLK
jgi:protocatechuate 3,4-dioxygenase beta subunit